MTESDKNRQVLSFQLGDETYGVDILAVKEIRGWSPVTRIPQSGEHVLGVLNLRGAIVPIMDLRRLFALSSAQFTAVTVVIVMSIATPDGARECGIVVDSVSDVVDVPAEAVRPAPGLSGQTNSEFIAGLAQVEDRMLILLDANGLLVRQLIAHPTAQAA